MSAINLGKQSMYTVGIAADFGGSVMCSFKDDDVSSSTGIKSFFGTSGFDAPTSYSEVTGAGSTRGAGVSVVYAVD